MSEVYEIEDKQGNVHQIKDATARESIEKLENDNEFAGKKILIAGDSVMYGYSWVGGFENLIKEKYPTATVLNKAVNGAFLSGGQIGNQIIEAYSEGFEPDIILIDGGGNDLFNSHSTTKMGALVDGYINVDISTVLGALEYLFYTLITNNPTVKIYFVGMYQFLETTSGTTVVPSYTEQLDWWNNIKSCCVKHGVPYIDLFAGGNFNASNYSIIDTYIPDGVHPNEAGYRRLFPLIDSVINGAPCSHTFFQNKDKLAGMKVLIIGDSIMAGDGWEGGYANLIKENHSEAEVVNLSISGATLIQNDTGNYMYNQFKNYYNPDAEEHGEEPDLIIFDGGGNDCMYRVEIGAVSENCGIDGHMGSMCDALEYLIYAIKSAYPHSKLLYVTTPLAMNWGTETIPSVPSYSVQLEYDNARRVVLEKWGIPIADVHREGNLTGCIEAQASIYYADGLHLNEAGYRYTHPIIEATIDKIF